MPQHINRHGNHQEIHLGAWRRDRIGILSGSAQRWRPENPEEINWELLQPAAAPQMNGVPCVNVERTYEEGCWGVYTYSYEGANSGYEFGDLETTYELDISMSEDPIETHVNFATLKKKYGWDTRKRQFAQFMPSSSRGGGLGGAKKAKVSDLYGTDSYLAVGGHYRVSYARRAVPPAAIARTNEIVNAPRGIERFALPGWAKRRNWLYLGPRVTHRGNVVQISEEYFLSGPRGWNADVYGAGKLSGGGGGDFGSGLTIGSL